MDAMMDAIPETSTTVAPAFVGTTNTMTIAFDS